MKLTSSEGREWNRCKRKWYLSTYRMLGKGDTPNTPTSIGNAYHDALAAYYDAAARGEYLVPAEYAARQYEALAQTSGDQEYLSALAKEADLVVTMLEGYLEMLQETGIDAGLTIVGSETTIEVPLQDVNDTVLLAKIDAPVVINETGLRTQLEHKTVQNLTDLPKTAQLSWQFKTYVLADLLDAMARGDGIYADGILLNMARKVKRTSRANPPFFGRVEVRYNIDELRQHWHHMVSVAAQILEARARLDAGEDHHTVCPPTPDRDCSFACPFFAVCANIDDGSDINPMLADLYTVRDPLSRYETEKGDPGE